jgi:hypothetical protein
VGEFVTRIFLFQHTRDQALATRGAAGWDGDRYVVLRTPRGDGIAWLTIWDSALDAAEFGRAMEAMVARRFDEPAAQSGPGGARRYSTAGRSLSLWGGEVAGRPAFLFVDVPEGTPTGVIDLARVRLEQ